MMEFSLSIVSKICSLQRIWSALKMENVNFFCHYFCCILFMGALKCNPQKFQSDYLKLQTCSSNLALSLSDFASAELQVCNHVASMDDPLVMAALLPPSMLIQAKNLRWTLCATDRCFTNAAFSAFFRSVKVLPLRRGAGLQQEVTTSTSWKNAIAI
jgi:hypothetical protein